MIQKRGILWLVVLSVLVLSTSVLAADTDCVYYFTAQGEGCPTCGPTDNYMNTLQDRHENLDVHTYEVYTNLSNYALLDEYFTAYAVPEDSRGVPAVFFGQSYLVGKNAIENLLESSLIDADTACPSLEASPVVGLIGEKSPHDVLKTFTFGILTGGALKDSLTACGLALLVIFLALLFAVHRKEKLLRVAIAFLLGLFVVYFCYGMTWLPKGLGKGVFFAKLIGAGALVLGAWKLYHFFRKEQKKKEEKSSTWRNKLTSPGAAFAYGLLATLLALPCMGNRFLVLRALVLEPLTRGTAVGLLLYYILVLLLPLLIVFLLVYRSYHQAHHQSEKKPEQKKKVWFTHFIKQVHLIVSVVMIILGFIILAL